MASNTKIRKVRDKLKAYRQGRKRKNQQVRHGTTPNWATFFGDPVESEVCESSAKA